MNAITNPAPRYSALTSASDSAALKSLEAWLPSVTGSDEIPAEKAALIPAARREIDRLMQPAATEQMAVELDRMAEWAETFNLPPKDWGKALDFYMEGLKHLPADLLSMAMQRARANHKMGMRLPLPIEIAAQVDDEVARRRSMKTKLFQASRCQVADPVTTPYRDMTPDQRASVDKMLEGLNQKFNWRSATSNS